MGGGEGPAPLEVRFARGRHRKLAAGVDGGHAREGDPRGADGGRGWGRGFDAQGGLGAVGVEGEGDAGGREEAEDAAVLLPRREGP